MNVLLRIICVIFILTIYTTPNALAERYTVIVCGSGGEEEYLKKFLDWGARLRSALVERLHFSSSLLTWLAADYEEGQGVDRLSTLDNIRSCFNDLAGRMTNVDDLFLFLIGHGGYLRSELKLHIPGPDLTAVELKSLVDSVPAKRFIMVNASSRSAGFINVLSATNRILCTATKSVVEGNAAEFMEFFLQGIEDGSADRNHDDRISTLEAFQQAAALTDAWYTSQGLLATEHALVDDDGDGLGTRVLADVDEDEKRGESDKPADGALAENCYLKDYTFPASVPNNLVENYRSLMDRIYALKRRKVELDSRDYYQQLETLFIQAAKTNREIRGASDRIAPH